jgi:hypothetical protein
LRIKPGGLRHSLLSFFPEKKDDPYCKRFAFGCGFDPGDQSFGLCVVDPFLKTAN